MMPRRDSVPGAARKLAQRQQMLRRSQELAHVAMCLSVQAPVFAHRVALT